MESPRRAPAKSRGPRSVPRRAHRRALIVDDETDFAELVAFWLRAAGWAVDIAGDGVQALALLADRRIDLIVADLQMPGMNGWELLRRLRNRWGSNLDPPNRPERIVVVSGRTENDVECFARHLGADAFLAKPVNRLTLFDTVTSLFTPSHQPHCSSAVDPRRL